MKNNTQTKIHEQTPQRNKTFPLIEKEHLIDTNNFAGHYLKNTMKKLLF